MVDIFLLIKESNKYKGKGDDDINTYDLIMKDKEKFSFDEPTRFIFSHSALREGWDNPTFSDLHIKACRS